MLSAVIPNAEKAATWGVDVISMREAVSWSGVDTTLSLFVVWPSAGTPVLEPEGVSMPDDLQSFDLDDVDGHLAGRALQEIDLVFRAFPDDVGSVVHRWLSAAIETGAELAWFAFEGSFDFEHLLTEDVADQIYGVADRAGVTVAVDDGYRSSRGWTDILAIKRASLVTP